MKLECYPLDDHPFDITPADRRREWMDQTTRGLAYRCLPLSMANAHGWFLRCVEPFEAVWHGGDDPKDLEVLPVEEGQQLFSVESHFGYGILTFNGRVILRTAPGYNLWVMGPTNAFKDAIQPLNGLIEADWMPHSFSMNWKFTRPETRIRFARGDPYALVFPVRRGDLEAVEPVFRKLEDNPELLAQSREARGLRGIGYVIEKYYPGDSKSFQGWYLRGEVPFRRGTFEAHERQVKVHPFKREGDDSRELPASDRADTSGPAEDGSA